MTGRRHTGACLRRLVRFFRLSEVGDWNRELDATHRLVGSLCLSIDFGAKNLNDTTADASSCGGFPASGYGNIKLHKESRIERGCCPQNGGPPIGLCQIGCDTRLRLAGFLDGGNNINEALPQKLMEVHI